MKPGKFLSRLYLVLMGIFLYAPILVLIILSFNNSKSRAHWGGFSLRWYQELIQNEDLLSALRNTLILAFLSALIAAFLGTLAALGINSMRRTPKTVILGITNIPMLNADIVTGISMMLCFIAFRLSFGLRTVLIAHITFNLPYVILSVMPKLRSASRVCYEAALDLGASPVYAFFRVMLPEIWPGILSGFLLAFTLSLDDFIITYFTKGAGFNTISTLVYSEVRRGINPAIYALSTLIFVTVFIVLLIMNFAPDFLQKKHRREAA